MGSSPMVPDQIIVISTIGRPYNTLFVILKLFGYVKARSEGTVPKNLL